MKKWKGDLDVFDGTFLDDSWRGRYLFEELRGAWARGEIDVTWWCTQCLAQLHGVKPWNIGQEDWDRRFDKRQGRTSKFNPRPQRR